MRGLRLLCEKLRFSNKAKQKEALLIKLEAALNDECLTPNICFNKEKCIKWANNVEVLLKDNSTQYMDWVAHRMTMLQTHDMFDGMGYLISRMKSVLDLTIKEMREDIKHK